MIYYTFHEKITPLLVVVESTYIPETASD
jgi:hypothetical protein